MGVSRGLNHHQDLSQLQIRRLHAPPPEEILPAPALKAEYYESASFSPNGSRLVFETRRCLPDLQAPTYFNNIPRQASLGILDGPTVQLYSGYSQPVWSPGGRRLAAIHLLSHDSMSLECYTSGQGFQTLASMPPTRYRCNFTDWLSEDELVAVVQQPEPVERISKMTWDRILRDFRAARQRAEATGFVDPSNESVIGQSFGGYAALIAATEPGLHAAVALSPLTDLISYHASVNPRTAWYPFDRILWYSSFPMYWCEKGQAGLGAPPWGDSAGYVRNSPVLNADAVRTPVLLVGTEFDPIIHQTEEMYLSLYELGKPCKLIRYRDEEHFVCRAPDVADLWDEIAAWLKR